MRLHRAQRPLHPLEHHPSFRAVIAAASPLAELATRLADHEIVGSLVIASSDLADGFAAPPDSARRVEAPAELLRRAQRAVDRADVLVGALLPN
jgi:hypothetical protein